MAKLVLLRHGQSVWNQQNIFTGWVDIPLSQKGVDEALTAGKKIDHIPFDTIYTSTLVRAQMTLFLAMTQSKLEKVPCLIHDKDPKHLEMARVHDPKVEKTLIPVYARSELNERMYGELQGLHKHETLKKFGEEQYLLWRRSYHINPPKGESLEMTAKRALPFFQNVIMNDLKNKKNILISAHGNSLRAIVMFLDRLSEQEVIKLEIPTGEPLCYEFKSDGSWVKEPVHHANDACRK